MARKVAGETSSWLLSNQLDLHVAWWVVFVISGCYHLPMKTKQIGKTKVLAALCSNAMDARVTSAFPLLYEGLSAVSQEKEAA